MDPVSLSSRVLSWLSLINHDEMTSSRVTRARVLPAASPESTSSTLFACTVVNRPLELVLIARELIAGRVLLPQLDLGIPVHCANRDNFVCRYCTATGTYVHSHGG